jgi:hypothetical protein
MYQESKELTVARPLDHPCFDEWQARIDAAEGRHFTLDDKGAAMCWTLCVVGAARKGGLIAPDWTGTPSNTYIRRLGGEFNLCVRRDDITGARAVFEAIKREVVGLAE